MTTTDKPNTDATASSLSYYLTPEKHEVCVAPAELRAECAAVPTFAQVCVGPDASGGEFMCAECLAAAI